MGESDKVELAEFIRTFTPQGALALNLERQNENRTLYHDLGLGAVSPVTAPGMIEQKMEADQPLVNPAPTGADARVPSSIIQTTSVTRFADDLPDFDTF